MCCKNRQERTGMLERSWLSPTHQRSLSGGTSLPMSFSVLFAGTFATLLFILISGRSWSNLAWRTPTQPAGDCLHTLSRNWEDGLQHTSSERREPDTAFDT